MGIPTNTAGPDIPEESAGAGHLGEGTAGPYQPPGLEEALAAYLDSLRARLGNLPELHLRVRPGRDIRLHPLPGLPPAPGIPLAFAPGQGRGASDLARRLVLSSLTLGDETPPLELKTGLPLAGGTEEFRLTLLGMAGGDISVLLHPLGQEQSSLARATLSDAEKNFLLSGPENDAVKLLSTLPRGVEFVLSPSWREAWGVEARVFSAEPARFLEMVARADRRRVRDLWLDNLEGQDPGPLVCRPSGADNNHPRILLRSTPILAGDGSRPRVTGLRVEVGEPEAAWREISLPSPQPDGRNHPVIRVNTRGDITRANNSFLDLLGGLDPEHWRELTSQLRWAVAAGKLEAQEEVELNLGERIFVFRAQPSEDQGEVVLHGRDITLYRALDRQERLLSLMFQHSMEGMVLADPQGKVVTVNPAFTAITGYSPGEVIGRGMNVFRSEELDEKFLESLWDGLVRHGQWSGEYWNRRKNGEAYPEWLSLHIIKGPDGAAKNFLAMFHDQSRERPVTEEIKYQAQHDALTGLPNRTLFQDRLAHNLAETDRMGASLALFFIDLDNLKGINDDMGHQAGDQLLRRTAARLQEAVRETDTVARLGGDEFTVTLTSLASGEQAGIVARKVLDCISRPMSLDGIEVEVTASLGIALYPQDAVRPEDLINRADVAMYQAKESGKNRYRFYNPNMTSRALRLGRARGRLTRALGREEFEIHYQPKIDLATGAISGMEGLLRWRTPQGLVHPGQFLSQAEDTGVIHALGQWGLEEACRQAREWGLRLGRPLSLCMNLSSKELMNRALPRELDHILSATGLDPALLELEIREGTLMESGPSLPHKLAALTELGVRLSLDDFGTGFSCLSYLNNMPFTNIKVENSLIQQLSTQEDGVKMVGMIVDLAHSLGLRVTAEGVENRLQLDHLVRLSCDLAQGNLFSPALPGPDFWRLLESGSFPQLFIPKGDKS